MLFRCHMFHRLVSTALILVSSAALATTFTGRATHYRWDGWVNTTSDLSLTAPPVQFKTVHLTCFDGVSTITGDVLTDALGRFSWAPPAAAGVCASMTAQVAGGGSEQRTTFSLTGYDSYAVAIERAPWAVSPDGSVWVRRVTGGKFAVFFIEGFDPDDTMKTGPEASGVGPGGVTADSLISLMQLSPVGNQAVDPVTSKTGNERPLPGRDLLSYLAQHDYGLYIVTAGRESRRSIRGSSKGALDGQAYQSAAVIHRTMALHRGQFGGSVGPNGQPFANPANFVVGGYSMGGLVAKYALKTWCADEFLPVPANELWGDRCSNLTFWFTGDSPLRGAQVPLALQRLIAANDGTISAGTGATKAKLSHPSAREMLTYSYWPDANPDTNCKGTGCDSSDFYFTMGDDPTSDVHDVLMSEVVGPIVRSGSVVPSFEFAVGTHPLGATLPGCVSGGKDAVINSTFFYGPPPAISGSIVLRVDNGYGGLPLTTWGPASTGRAGECVPGSTWNPPIETGSWAAGKWAFIPTASALEWEPAASNPPSYADYWFSQVVRDHSRQMPPEPTSILTAWLDESLKGFRSSSTVPVTGALPGYGKATRFSAVEDPTNGVDDDGDDHIDNQDPARSLSFFAGGTSIADLAESNTAQVYVNAYASGGYSCFPLGGVTVSLVNLSHTYVGDIKAELLHLPYGAGLGATPKVHPLFGRIGGTYASRGVSGFTMNLAGRVGTTFQTSFAGQAPGTVLNIGGAGELTASGFAGEDSCGQWWVRFTDMAGADVGSLSSWRLTLSQDLYR